jgi:hypothetical protein
MHLDASSSLCVEKVPGKLLVEVVALVFGR